MKEKKFKYGGEEKKTKGKKRQIKLEKKNKKY